MGEIRDRLIKAAYCCPYDKPPLFLVSTRVIDEHGQEVHFTRDPNAPSEAGAAPPMLCAACPWREKAPDARPLRSVEIVRTIRAAEEEPVQHPRPIVQPEPEEEPVAAAPEVALDLDVEKHDDEDLPRPPGWSADHPALNPRTGDSVPPPRRRRDAEPIVRPEDFGLTNDPGRWDF